MGIGDSLKRATQWLEDLSNGKAAVGNADINQLIGIYGNTSANNGVVYSGATGGLKSLYTMSGERNVSGMGRDLLSQVGGNTEAAYNLLSKTSAGRAFLKEKKIKKPQDFNSSLMSEFEGKQVDLGAWDRINLAHTNLATGEYSTRKLGTTALGGFMGASAIFRIGSGGGIYRDKDGNADLIGIPFV